jgi:thiol-disulfide isomerase/thioredoxin
MGKLVKRIVVGLLALLLLAACAGLLLFKLVENRLAARLKPPELQREPMAASDMTYRTLDGAVEHLSAAKGQVVFLNLWGMWCIGCVAEMPTVQRLYDHYRNDPRVKFLIVSRLDSPERVRGYARLNHFNLPFYVTQDADIPDTLEFHQYPATFVFAKDGTLVARHLGAADWSDRSVVEFIDRLKAESR